MSPETTKADVGLFHGDTGELPLDTRRVMVQLLLGPSVDARRQSKLWGVLVRDEALIRSRLHELFLELVLDAEQRIAFTRQVVAEDLEVPILLRKSQLTFIETALLLFLRQQLTQADARAERAVVSRSDVHEHLAVFEREANADRAKYERQVAHAIEKAKKLNLLQGIRGADDRFEVSPTLKILFTAEEIQDLTRAYQALMQKPALEGEADEDLREEETGLGSDEAPTDQDTNAREES